MGRAQHRDGLVDRGGGDPSIRARPEAFDVQWSGRLGQCGFLHPGVEIDVDRSHRRGAGQPYRASQRLLRGGGRSGLGVPFDIVTQQRALVLRGVDPIDPRPPAWRVDRAGGAHQQQRSPVAPGVEHGHRRVQQPDIGVHRRRHRPAGHFGPPVREGDRAFLMQADKHPGSFVAEVIDDAVVQPAIARSRVQRDERDIESA